MVGHFQFSTFLTVKLFFFRKVGSESVLDVGKLFFCPCVVLLVNFISCFRVFRSVLLGVQVLQVFAH